MTLAYLTILSLVLPEPRPWLLLTPIPAFVGILLVLRLAFDRFLFPDVEVFEQMDPVTFLGLVSSLIEIANFVKEVSAQTLAREFSRRAEQSGTPESRLQVTPAEVLDAASDVVALRDSSPAFLDRIKNRCLAPYDKAIATEPTEAGLDEAFRVAQKCVCENISMARRESGGRFPSDQFRHLWEQFRCGSL